MSIRLCLKLANFPQGSGYFFFSNFPTRNSGIERAYQRAVITHNELGAIIFMGVRSIPIFFGVIWFKAQTSVEIVRVVKKIELSPVETVVVSTHVGSMSEPSRRK